MFFMKKNLMKGMAALCVCAAFASCSKDAGFETPTQEQLAKNEYKANFIKKYGEIDPNQSWDFTNYGSASQARTRGEQAFAADMEHEEYNFFSFVNTDFAVIKNLLHQNSYSTTIRVRQNTGLFSYNYTTYNVNGSVSVKDWNHFFTAILTPTYAHIKAAVGADRYYHLGFSYNNAEPVEMIANIRVKGLGLGQYSDHWYDALSGTLDHHTARVINTTTTGGNGYWTAYYIDEKNDVYFKTTPITKIKEFKITVNGTLVRTYWGFDCDGDNDYSDVICLVEDYQTPQKIVKRYLIEDLGDKDDFDFNDIVVDVEDDQMGHQKATIRALGGTIDFTLKIGDTEWNKVNDGAKLTPVVNEIDMINTDPAIDFTKVIAQYPVSGWRHADNNIVVTVRDKNNPNVITRIPFPERGEAPLIIAVKPIVYWMEERVSIPKWWFDENEPRPEGEEIM